MNWAMDELEARARAQLGTLQDFGERLDLLASRETSADGLVTVEVDGSGALIGLWLSDGANELGAVTLGDRIVATAALAAQDVFARRAQVLADLHSVLTDQLGARPSTTRLDNL
ncbi:MAG: YbaB/EbfC family DNA-binding protein [Gordonia sp. (in: high G+C Gram-positive bacteria)]